MRWGAVRAVLRRGQRGTAVGALGRARPRGRASPMARRRFRGPARVRGRPPGGRVAVPTAVVLTVAATWRWTLASDFRFRVHGGAEAARAVRVAGSRRSRPACEIAGG